MSSLCLPNKCLLRIFTSALVTLVATRVRADDGMRHVALHYFSNDDSCPSRQLITDVAAAGVNGYFIWDDAAATAITVSLLPDWPDAYTAVVTATDRSQQTFHAATCAELEQPVTDAVAALINGSDATPPVAPAPTVATLQMRTTDGRALGVERITSTEWHYGKHSHWRAPKTTEPLCTTPCSATVPVGEALFRFTDLTTQGDVQLAATTVSANGVLDIDYTANAMTRHRIIRNATIGGVVTAVVIYSLVALALRANGDSNSIDYFVAAPYASLLIGIIGATIGGVATGGEWSDKATLTVHLQ